MSSDPTAEFLSAFLVATPERREEALRVMKGVTPTPQPRQVTGPLLLGVCDAAKFLGVSRATLWRAIQAGRICKVELYPGSFRLRRADVERLAEGSEAAHNGRQTTDNGPVVPTEGATQVRRKEDVR